MRSSAAAAMDDNQKLEQRFAWWRSDPTNSRLYRECADLARALRRYDLLLSLTDEALRREPENPAIRFDQVNAHIGLHDFRAALQGLAEIPFESNEQETAIALNRGLCHFCLNDFAAAVKELTPAYERGGASAETVRMLVRAHHHLGQMEQALELAGANAAPAKADGVLAGTYALLYFDAGDVAKATQWARTGLQLQPDNIDSRVVEGHLLILRRQIDPSRQLLESVVHDAPATARGWIGLGTLALLEGSADKAVALLERGLELMPEHVGTWHLLGWTKLMQRDFAGAERALTHALSLDRNFAESHGALAALDALRGDVASARQRIEVARRLDPNGLASQYATVLVGDPQLKDSQSRAAVQQIANGIGVNSQSALGKLLRRQG